MPQIDDDLLARVKALLDDVCSDKLRYQIIGQAQALKALLGPPVDADLLLARALVSEHVPYEVDWLSGEGDNAYQMLIAKEAIRRVRKLEAEECANFALNCPLKLTGTITEIRTSFAKAIRQRSADHGA